MDSSLHNEYMTYSIKWSQTSYKTFAEYINSSFYNAYECDVIDINSLKIFTSINQRLENKITK